MTNLVFTKTIFPITQETDDGCAIACIAMAAGITFNEVVEAKKLLGIGRPEELALRTEEIKRLLSHFKLDTIHYAESKLYYGRVYVIGVPSLNVEMGAHAVLIDAREDFLVFDPADKSLGKKFYTADPFLRGVVGYSDVLELIDLPE